MELLIRPVPPFSLDLSARIFSGGDERFQVYGSETFRQAIQLGKRLALIKVRSLKTVEDPLLSVEIMPADDAPGNPDRDLSSDGAKAAKSIVTRLFNLDLDLLPFYDAVKGDPVMAELSLRLRGLRSPSTATVFEALIDSIIEQQISLQAARSMQRKLTLAFGMSMNFGGVSHYVFPGPERLSSATIDQLRGCGLSGRKAEYVLGVSKLVTEGLDLEGLRKYHEQKIIEELGKIRGVGIWTAEMTMIRGMQKFDAIPADDLGLKRIISHYYYNDKKISEDGARHAAERWKGWRGLASFYLIVAEMLGIEV
jgi:DNA-3-methyladenine glycosylase II